MSERKKVNTSPHVAIIKFSVFIHKMLPDGSIEPQVVDCSELFKDSEMTNKAQMYVQGFDKWDCVQKVKETLEKLK